MPLIPRDGDTTALTTGSTRLTDSWAGVAYQKKKKKKRIITSLIIKKKRVSADLMDASQKSHLQSLLTSSDLS